GGGWGGGGGGGRQDGGVGRHRSLESGAGMRRFPLVGFVVSAVAHVVAVMLLILVVERLTALPGLFIDLTTHATESRSASRPGGESPNERKLPTAPAKRSPEPPPGPSRARTGDSASPPS